ncbi:hypothetical protein NIES593_02275 [Hydrococcus rivularis NIES-593]|uniref:Uncharacterized protein n=1 Tax=Hydrococcus rivularis NIES-593 TaxID=1921803 RepID=A0A1U7HTH4_9CYAN|nr:hypothetical protein NIES593_02275 [Hydrococcus rivularis NIES-593]
MIGDGGVGSVGGKGRLGNKRDKGKWGENSLITNPKSKMDRWLFRCDGFAFRCLLPSNRIG